MNLDTLLKLCAALHPYDALAVDVDGRLIVTTSHKGQLESLGRLLAAWQLGQSLEVRRLADGQYTITISKSLPTTASAAPTPPGRLAA